MRLCSANLPRITNSEVLLPSNTHTKLPQRVVQFGTGVLLRGLCDYFIDKANRSGIFNGRVLVVKSTSAGDAVDFADQDNLYTVCIRGMNNGEIVKENIVCAAISRVVSANTHWEEVLKAAENAEIEVVISNTTEVGLQLVNESIHLQPPASFPAKLLAFLYRRYQFFGSAGEGKLVVVPTELLTDNGKKLKKIIKSLAAYNQLEPAFVNWLHEKITFCNSLVDRIVTKDPGADTINALQKELGYEDALLTMCEDYRLWAIEGGDEVRDTLSFCQADEGVFVVPDIELYKSLKLHLLNGTHTFSASLAFLAGYNTVKEAMEDKRFYRFVQQLMLEEISPAIPFRIDEEQKNIFGKKVLDRFSNPFLQHHWLNITFQNTLKMKNRNVPVIQQFFTSGLALVPDNMTTGFAAYILFMKSVKQEDNIFYGKRDDQFYRINDDHAAYYFDLWQRETDPVKLVEEVLSNTMLWETDLSQYQTFSREVAEKLSAMIHSGVKSVLFKNVVI